MTAHGSDNHEGAHARGTSATATGRQDWLDFPNEARLELDQLIDRLVGSRVDEAPDQSRAYA